jgi:UDP-2,3-diacylglucosamine hydrolase
VTLRFDAPAHWRAIEFISDLHLSAALPRTFDAWAGYLAGTDADAVFILGDLFEAWVGDDARFDGFEKRCAQVLADAARQRTVGFMAGNRDFLVGPALLDEAGVVHLSDPTLLAAWQHRVLLTHGDALCLGDVDYQRFRALVRSPAWQADFLARPLAERQHLARQMRDASEQAKRQNTPWSDVDPGAAAAALRGAGASVMVHGHTHRPGSNDLAPGLQRHVLSDWDLDAAPTRAEVLRLTPQGFSRLPYRP